MKNRCNFCNTPRTCEDGLYCEGCEAKKNAPKCCDDENNHIEDDSETHICASCKEHTSKIICEMCGETVFSSSCCG